MTRAQEWKQKAAAQAAADVVDLELPSGMTIRARRPGPVQLAMWGRLPLAMAVATIKDGGGGVGEASPEELVEGIKFMRELLVYCCVEPRISDDPKGDDEIHPREIPEADWRFIIRWAMGSEEAAKLRPFRGERAGDRAGGVGEDVGRAAIADDLDPGSTVGVGV
jgi:hypothetical protein